MFGIFKFFWIVLRAFPDLLKIDRNALQAVPDPSKYLAMILLSCFWCLSFGMYFGDLLAIAPNMMGHVGILTMVFVTWATFRHYRTLAPARLGVDYLRAPDRSSRCDEYTAEDRELMSKRY